MTRVPVAPEHALAVRVALRWGDMDSLGHVNNVIFLRLLEEARVQFLAGMAPAGEHGFGVLAARHEIDYLRPLHYSAEPVEIRLWVERIGTSSCTIGYLVLAPGGPVVCAARTVIVSIDTASGAPVPIPAPLRERLEAFAG